MSNNKKFPEINIDLLVEVARHSLNRESSYEGIEDKLGVTEQDLEELRLGINEITSDEHLRFTGLVCHEGDHLQHLSRSKIKKEADAAGIFMTNKTSVVFLDDLSQSQQDSLNDKMGELFSGVKNIPEDLQGVAEEKGINQLYEGVGKGELCHNELFMMVSCVKGVDADNVDHISAVVRDNVLQNTATPWSFMSYKEREDLVQGVALAEMTMGNSLEM